MLGHSPRSLVGVLILTTLYSCSPTFRQGDVFVTVADNHATARHYDNAGNLLEVLDTGISSYTNGCGFDGSGRLYMGVEHGPVFRFDGPGTPHTVSSFVTAPWPASILFDDAGNAYVGELQRNLLKFDSAGNLLTTFVVPNGPGEGDGGCTSIDLAADQCTMFHVFQGATVARFDVCSNTPLANFAGGLTQAATVRLLPCGGLLVADIQNIKRFDAAGHLIQTYDVGSEDGWWALDLDPNGTSFWAGSNAFAGAPPGTWNNFYKLNLASGGVELGPINTGTPPLPFRPPLLGGICVFGERPRCERWTFARVLRFLDVRRIVQAFLPRRHIQP